MRFIHCSLLIFSLLAVTAARAVIVYGPGGNSTTYTTLPTIEGGWIWNYVGSAGGASAVYLGDYNGSYWVITAAHVGANGFTLGGTAYQAISGSGIRITNTDGLLTDLLLYQISSNPGLANLTLSPVSPATGSLVIMIGNGRNRSDSLDTWWVDIDTDPYTWSSSWFPEEDGSVQAYAYANGNTKRWGINMVESFEVIWETTSTFVTKFDASSGEAQGSTGDSGGGVFFLNQVTGEWELAGIISAIGYLAGDKVTAGVDLTYSIDLATYYDSIMAAIWSASPSPIPERATGALWLGILLGAGAIWRRRSARQSPSR
ncbi:MAG: trypsin-like serine protease [Opitutaceae bacterium]|jgi:hypothetical protein|nr:trypsin-like serine protease [Opitutaceae bacterium]